MVVAAGGLVLVFAIWWWYFEHPAEDGLRSAPRARVRVGVRRTTSCSRRSAALGAGLEVAAEATQVHSEVSTTTAGLTIAISTAVYLGITALLHIRLGHHPVEPRVVVAAIVLILAFGALADPLTLGVAVPLIGLVMAFVVFLDVRHDDAVRAAEPGAAAP